MMGADGWKPRMAFSSLQPSLLRLGPRPDSLVANLKCPKVVISQEVVAIDTMSAQADGKVAIQNPGCAMQGLHADVERKNK